MGVICFVPRVYYGHAIDAQFLHDCFLLLPCYSQHNNYQYCCTVLSCSLFRSLIYWNTAHYDTFSTPRTWGGTYQFILAISIKLLDVVIFSHSRTIVTIVIIVCCIMYCTQSHQQTFKYRKRLWFKHGFHCFGDIAILVVHLLTILGAVVAQW